MIKEGINGKVTKVIIDMYNMIESCGFLYRPTSISLKGYARGIGIHISVAK